jgi:hypothetical protein
VLNHPLHTGSGSAVYSWPGRTVEKRLESREAHAHGNEVWLAACRIGDLRSKRAIAVPQQHAHRFGNEIHNRQVGDAVTVEVSHCDGVWIGGGPASDTAPNILVQPLML